MNSKLIGLMPYSEQFVGHQRKKLSIGLRSISLCCHICLCTGERHIRISEVAIDLVWRLLPCELVLIPFLPLLLKKGMRLTVSQSGSHRQSRIKLTSSLSMAPRWGNGHSMAHSHSRTPTMTSNPSSGMDVFEHLVLHGMQRLFRCGQSGSFCRSSPYFSAWVTHNH